MAHHESALTFKCPVCGAINSEEVTVPDSFANDGFIQIDAELACEKCRKIFVLHIQNMDGIVIARFPDYPQIQLSAGRAMLIEDVLDTREYDVPEKPGSELWYALQEIRQVVTEGAERLFSPALHRMAFVQQFAALEAFLCDTLLQQMREKPKAMERMISMNRDLKRVTLTLGEVYRKPRVVEDCVESILRREMFHNLAKVELFYEIALQVKLFSDPAIKKRLFAAVPVRHDCVHRNGKRMDGSHRNEVDHAYVWQMEYDIKHLLSHVECVLGLDDMPPWVPVLDC